MSQPQAPESHAAPAPETLLDWLASDSFALRQQAYAALVHPQFAVTRVAEQVMALARSQNTQERQVAAVAMGKNPAFASTLGRMLGAGEHPVVRTAAAHALFRVQSCPNEALPGLAAMLLSLLEAERKIAEAALRAGPAERFEVIAELVRRTPAEKLTPEILAALATAAQANPGLEASLSQWLHQLASRSLPAEIRLAILAALARLSQGKQGLAELLLVAEKGDDSEQRKLAMAFLGTLGEFATSCQPALARLLTQEKEATCEAALYRLITELRTPAEHLPLAFLLQRIQTSEAPPILAGACMALSLGGQSLARFAAILAARHAQAPEALRAPLAACYEKLAGRPLPV